MTFTLGRFTRPAVAPAARPVPRPKPAARARPVSTVNPIVRAAFYLFVLSIPFEMPDRTIPVEIPTLTGAIFLLATALNPSSAYKRVPGAVLWFILYLWMFGFSVVVNTGEYARPALEMFLTLLQVVLLLWVGANLLRDHRVMRGVLIALAVACALRAGIQILGIGATSYTVWTGGIRTTALHQNANISAIILSAGLVVMLSLRPRLITWPFAFAIGVAIIQTGSRGGLACAVAGVLLLLFQGHTFWAHVRSGVMALAAVGLLIFGALRSDMMRHRFEEAAEGTLAGREVIYPALLQMVAERPLLGWGPVDNQREIAERIGEMEQERRDAHNLVLELLSTTGVLGAVPFLLGLLLCIRAAWRARRGPLSMLPFALLSAVLVGTISGTWISAKVIWLAMAIALAAGARVTERRVCAV